MRFHYDREGRPINLDEFARLYELPGYKQVANTDLPEHDAAVSTVWLGINHQYGDGPPIIFETMVFGGGLDQYQERYSTEGQARAGHQQVIEKVRSEAAAFLDLVADPDVRSAVDLLEKRLVAHDVEHWGIKGLDCTTLYGRVAKAVQA